MLEDKRLIEIADMLHACVFERGVILTASITLENTINLFLAQHFCKGNGKEIEIIETLFATKKFTFHSKRDTMQAILKNNSEVYSVDYNKLCKEVQDIGSNINIFAHYPLDNRDESLKLFKKTGAFTFTRVENSSDVIIYTTEQIEELKKMIYSAQKLIHTLLAY